MEVDGVARPSGGGGGPKKLVIKAFKEPPKLPENFEEETWAKLQAAVRAVHAQAPVAFSFEELYRVRGPATHRASFAGLRRAERRKGALWCEACAHDTCTLFAQCVGDLCLHRRAAALYARLVGELEAQAARQVEALAGAVSCGACGGGDDGAVALLARLESTWRQHSEATLTVRSVFLVLDRSYALTSPGVRPLWDAALHALRCRLRDHPLVEARAVRGLLVLVQRERVGEQGSRALLKALLRAFSALGLYGDAFERPFLDASQAFYAAEGTRLMASAHPTDYLRHCEARLQEESERAAAVLEPPTRKPLLTTCENALVARHLPQLLDKGFEQLMAASQERLPDLARLYALAGRVGQHDALKTALAAYVRAAGTRLVRDESKDGEMVSGLLEMKASMDVAHAQAFGGNEAFGHALKDAFEGFLNSRANRPAELVAKYLDAALRAGNKGTTEEELEALLDRLLTLFRYLSGKDVFEAFYKKDLAKRLLLGKSASIEAEKSMISKLKAECGAQFTAKLEGMFKDVDLSRDILSKFRAAKKESPPLLATEASVSVLTATCVSSMRRLCCVRVPGTDLPFCPPHHPLRYWPSYPPAEVALPAEIGALQQLFSEYYLQEHGNRRLAWQHALGHTVLRARFPCGVRELSVSLFQTAVLLLFNDDAQLSFADIKAATSIEDRELRRQLQVRHGVSCRACV